MRAPRCVRRAQSQVRLILLVTGGHCWSFAICFCMTNIALRNSLRRRSGLRVTSWRIDSIGSRAAGWSNGGSTTLNVMIRQAARQDGFRAALAFYPGCGREALLKPVVATTAPIAMFLGSDDEEVSPTICQHVADRSRAAGTPIDVTLYPGATHDFDDPGEKRQSVPGNAAAKADAMQRAIAVVEGTK